jgi:heptosyltransferase-2
MPEPFEKILIIQTASIGDTILFTPVVETLAAAFPGAAIDVLIKKGFESLFAHHPLIRQTMVWDKSGSKYRNLFRLLIDIRRQRYDLVINAQRFLSTGLLTAFSGARITTGFDKNPLSRLFTHRIPHRFENAGRHEIDRNLALVAPLVPSLVRKIKLYPEESDFQAISHLKTGKYICLAPASLWFTKQYPEDRWVEFLDQTDPGIRVYLLGSQADLELCARILNQTRHRNVISMSGKLTLLQTAALMKDARMNYVNDSAPLHLASAVNARVTAVFCSTVPEFGFGPLSEDSLVVETREELSCRPCGLHGHKACPEKHFRCARSIDTQKLIERLHDEN